LGSGPAEADAATRRRFSVMGFEFLDPALLLAAFAGGLFGAAVGGLPAFIFTGFAVLLGVAAGLGGSEFNVLAAPNDPQGVAFGVIFGPHVSFAGGAAAAAFAARRGDIEDGKDIATPLAGLGDPLPLLVGGLFGVGGLVVQQLLAGLLGSIGAPLTATDTIAFTVAVSAVVARLAFGKTGLFGNLPAQARGERDRFRTGGERVWLGYQEGFLQASIIGLGAGILAAWIVVAFAGANPDYAQLGVVLGFGFSAVSLILLQIGFDSPVTHHMTLPGGVAAAAVVGAGGAPLVAVLLGGVAGIGGALLGELFSRLFLIHGDTHIDPPANAIWVMATAVFVVALLLA
jgi:hypothetical protein